MSRKHDSGQPKKEVGIVLATGNLHGPEPCCQSRTHHLNEQSHQPHGLFKDVLPHRKRCFHFLLSNDRRLFRIGRLPSKPMNSVNPLHWAEPTQKYQGAVPFRCVKS